MHLPDLQNVEDVIDRSTEECAWCGAAVPPEAPRNRRGEHFCSEAHRAASGRALRRFLAADSR